MIEFQDQVFATKTAFAEHLKDGVHALPINVELTGEDRAFAVAVLMRRKDAKGKIGPSDIIAFWVAPNGAGRELNFRRGDGSTDSFSWRKAVTEVGPAAYADAAMRYAVLPQIKSVQDDFFARGGGLCELSGVELTRSNSEVDHISPTFAEIREQWVEAEGGVENIAISRETGGARVSAVLANADQAARWAEFHKAAARLRVISAAANRSRHVLERV